MPLAASEDDVTRRKAGADDMPTQARRSIPGAPPPPADAVPPGAYAGGASPARGGLSTGVIIAIVAGVVMIAAAATAGFILFADPTNTETAKTEQSRKDAERRAREAEERRRAAEEARRKEAEARRKGSTEAQRREAERKRRAEEERKRQAEANRRRGSTSGEEDDGDSGPQPGTTAPRGPQQSAKLTISSFRIRNRCNYPVRAMIHIKDPQRDWTTFGWVSIGAGQLTREFPTRNRHVYYYGVSLNGQVIFNRGNQGNAQRLLRWQGQQYRVGHVNMGPKFIRWTVNFC